MADILGNNNVNTIDVLGLPTIACKCGCKLFDQRFVLKRVSSLYTGTGRDELVSIPVWICSECGAIPEEMMSETNKKALFGEETNSILK